MEYLIQDLLASMQFVVPLHTFHIPVCHRCLHDESNNLQIQDEDLQTVAKDKDRE